MLGDGDNNFVSVGSHDELTVLGCHQVIGFVRAFLEFIGKGVIALALLGLGASNRDDHALTIDKANALTLGGCSDVVVGERLAVVGLVCPLGGQGYNTLRNHDAL